MYSRKTCLATLLSAVRHADALANHLVSHPFDFTVLTPLIKAAKAIGECAQALRQKELRQLSQRLVAASQMDITTPAGVAELKATMARVISIAETFGDLNSTKRWTEADISGTAPDDPFSSLTGTKWVVL